MVMSLTLGSATAQYASRPPDERFKDWSSFSAYLAQRRTDSRVYSGAVKRLHVIEHPEEGLACDVGGKAQFPMSHYAFSQVSSLAGAPAEYLRKLPTDLAARNLNYGLQFGDEKFDGGDAKLMTTSGRLRAITSTTYGRIWDSEIDKGVRALNERLRGVLKPAPTWDGNVSLFAGDRDAFWCLVDGGSVIEEPGGFGHRPSALHRGVMIRNGECGGIALEFLLFWFRVICGNLIIHDGSVFASVRIVHRRLAAEHLAKADTAGMVANYLNSATDRDMAIITKAQQYLLPEPKEQQVAWLRQRKFTASESANIIELARTEEGDSRTLWQVVQGGTALARALPYADDQTDLSRRTTALLKLAA